MSLKTLHCTESHRCRQDSPDQRRHRCCRRGRRMCRWLRWWCTARCSLWSPPTAAGSPHSPPTSGCRSRRRFRMSRAWQQRSYLNNVCVGQGQRTEKKKRRGRRGGRSITATRFSRGHMQRGRCASKEDEKMERFYRNQKQSSILHSQQLKTFSYTYFRG